MGEVAGAGRDGYEWVEWVWSAECGCDVYMIWM
jgi:hypothetical protein